MIKIVSGSFLFRLFINVFFLITVLADFCFAEEMMFGDWVCMQETDSETKKKIKKIGTYAKDGVSSLWISESDFGRETIQLTLKSKNIIDSDYFSYRIDKNKALTISTALRTCESYCLTEYIMKNSELIKTMKTSYRMKFEYSTYPEIDNQPTFSLMGFTKAFHWLLNK